MRSSIILVLAVFSLLLERTFQKKCDKEKFVCGKRLVDDPLNDYEIEHNTTAYPGQWPWYSAIYVRTNNRKMQFKCGGALISEKHVLTSKFCITNESDSMLEANKFLIRLGTHKQDVFNFGFARHRNVRKIHQPVDYYKRSEKIEKNEIVILEMNAKVTFNKYVQVVCIEDKYLRPGDVYIVGWGGVESSVYLGTFRDKYIKCDSKDIYGFHSNLCNKDRGSILQTYNEHINVWSIYAIIDCEKDSCKPSTNVKGFIRLRDNISFIIKVTNLKYLQLVRVGHRYDPSKKYPNLLPRLNCGHNFTKLIKEKTNIEIYEGGWIAQILIDGADGQGWKNMCLGSLISYRYVLSKGICVQSSYPMKVRLGAFNRTLDTKHSLDFVLPPRDYDVEYSVLHPDYDYLFTNDVALIRTTRDVRFEDHIYPVCLPVSSELKKMTPSKYIFAQWDLDDEMRSDNGILHEVAVIAMKNSGDYDEQIIDKSDYDKFHLKYENVCESDLKNDSSIVLNITNILPNLFSYGPAGQYIENRFVLFASFYRQYKNLSILRNISFDMDWIVANVKD